MAVCHSDSDDYETCHEDDEDDERYHSAYDDDSGVEAAADYIEGNYNDRTLYHQDLLEFLEELSEVIEDKGAKNFHQDRTRRPMSSQSSYRAENPDKPPPRRSELHPSATGQYRAQSMATSTSYIADQPITNLPMGFITSSMGFIGNLFTTLRPSKNFDTIRHRFLQKVQGIINTAFGGSLGEAPQVRLFGSSCDGLGTDDCDVDLTILLPTSANSHDCTNVILLSKIMTLAGMKDVSCIINTSVPICKFYDPEFNLHAQINTHNLLGLETTKLIHTYLQMDKRLEVVIRLVKYWAKRRGLNDPAGTVGNRRTLSSYAYVLMVINFFQVKGLLPSLQELTHGKSARMCRKMEKVNRDVRELDVHAVTYMGYLKNKIDFERLKATWSQSKGVKVVSGPVGIPPSHVQIGILKHYNRKYWNVSFEEMSCSCGVVKNIALKNSEKSTLEVQKEAIGLFYDVMKYYAWDYEYSEEKVVSIRMGGVLKTMTQELWRSQSKECYLVVEDPFQ
ncbi:hypothetical protein HDU76_008878, partial [Blyttiomyces sp. JEL0837]